MFTMEESVHDPFNLSRSLFVITHPDKDHDDVSQHLASALRGGATHLLVRRPSASPSEVYDLVTTHVTNRRKVPMCSVLVHDRVDVAMAAHAQGAHLNHSGIPFGPAKRLLGDARLLGVSVHGVDQAVAAALQGADYVMFGHVYRTPSHPGEPGRGLGTLSEVASSVDIPVIAIGGITPDRVGDVRAAGAAGVAVMRAISDASDPWKATRQFRTALDESNKTRDVAVKEEQ